MCSTTCPTCGTNKLLTIEHYILYQVCYGWGEWERRTGECSCSLSLTPTQSSVLFSTSVICCYQPWFTSSHNCSITSTLRYKTIHRTLFVRRCLCYMYIQKSSIKTPLLLCSADLWVDTTLLHFTYTVGQVLMRSL